MTKSNTDKEIPDPRAYHSAVAFLKKELGRTELTGTKALTRIKLQAYWNIGERLAALGPVSKALLKKLANDVGVSAPALYRCKRFCKTWPQGVPQKYQELSWVCHVHLLSVADKSARRYYLTECLRNGWSESTLARAIAHNLYDLKASGQTLPPAPVVTSPGFVYQAELESVVDGDTIDVRIDVGFHMWARQRLRLRGINTAELPPSKSITVGADRCVRPSTEDSRPSHQDAGTVAKQFVVNALTTAAGLVVQTFKSDIYGRYIAEVYYHPIFKDLAEVVKSGKNLSHELLTHGLARPMMV